MLEKSICVVLQRRNWGWRSVDYRGQAPPEACLSSSPGHLGSGFRIDSWTHLDSPNEPIPVVWTDGRVVLVWS